MEINSGFGKFSLCEVTIMDYKDREYYEGGTKQNSDNIVISVTSLKVLFEYFDKDAERDGFERIKDGEDGFSRTYEHSNGRIRTYTFEKTDNIKKILIDDELLKK